VFLGFEEGRAAVGRAAPQRGAALNVQRSASPPPPQQQQQQHQQFQGN
jgi:hypothetical protein